MNSSHISTRQDWSPETYLRNAAFVPELGRGVVEILDARAGEHILDLGCGEGTLSAVIQATGASVLAIDSSAAQVEAARARGLDAEVMDGLELDFS
ncbi:MAG TPA: methyltransferase domain-containing protein, partial [Magnetovibrio sp.]